MVQIPILNGIFVSNVAKLRTSYPRNLIPTPKENGISKGYLRPGEGLVKFNITDATSIGIDRGGINWNNVLYRVLGSKLVSVDTTGAITILGDVGYGNDYVSFAYSFDRLAIVSNTKMYYWLNLTLQQVVDGDLGLPTDLIWVDNYFMATDGTSIVVTDLNDPFSVNPLKYGSAEIDPDPILALVKLRNEPQIVGRYTIEVLQNIGGSLFPFQRVDGAGISRGAIGKKAVCVFAAGQADQLAFLGSGKNEPCAVYIGSNGVSVKISTSEIDKIIKGYTETELATAVVETRLDENHAFIYVHLPTRTMVYDFNASQVAQQSVWFDLDSGLGPTRTQYKARFLVWCYNQWNFGDPTSPRLGIFSEDISSHYGSEITWQFTTLIIYNQAMGGIIHELEIVSLTGDIAVNDDPTMSTSYSTDGVNYSMEKFIKVGRSGDRNKRINWLQQGHIKKFRTQRFRGTSKAHISMLALEARIEALTNGG